MAGDITEKEVKSYLEGTGHRLLTDPLTKNDGLTWTCLTKKKDARTYYSVVFNEDNCILTYEDIMVG
jgi:hypothetical protein